MEFQDESASEEVVEEIIEEVPAKEQIVEEPELIEDDVTEIPDQPLTPEDNSNEAEAEDDHFVIPEGNGVSENGLEEQVDEDMAEEPNTETVNNNNNINGILTPEEKSTAADTGEVAMDAIEARNDDRDHATKRKNEGDGEVEMKKQKTEEKPGDYDCHLISELKHHCSPFEITATPEPEPEPEPVKPPKLPELEKFWKPVLEDSTNFTGWTYLLQYVDQEVNAIKFYRLVTCIQMPHELFVFIDGCSSRQGGVRCVPGQLSLLLRLLAQVRRLREEQGGPQQVRGGELCHIHVCMHCSYEYAPVDELQYVFLIHNNIMSM